MEDRSIPRSAPPPGFAGLVDVPELPANPVRDGPRTSEDSLRSEIRGPTRLTLDPSRQRLREGITNLDPFDIADIYAQYAPTRGDPTKGNIDNEIDFNWKRYETFGKQDYAEQRSYYDQGWRPVMHSMFPGRFAPEGTEGAVIVKDMILMERPMRLTVKARNEEMEQANRAMRVNQLNMTAKSLPLGPVRVIKDRTTTEAIEIPEA